MRPCAQVGLLVALLIGCVILAGCPGMPAGAGGKGASQVPPGVQPPPGLQSGGARTLMGTTITPPDDAALLVSFVSFSDPKLLAAYVANRDLSRPAGQPGIPEAPWQSCRRVIPLESYVLVEGLNYDGRDKAAEKDVNRLIPAASLTYLQWKYEPKPTEAVAAGAGAPGERRGVQPRSRRSPAARATSRRASGR